MFLIAVVAAYPIIYAMWLSLHEYSVRQAGLSRWAGPIGLRNYQNALSSGEWWASLSHTLIFTVTSVTLELFIGLAMALAMHSAFKGQGLLRTVVLVPWAVLTVVTAIMWRTMFVSPYGFVNTLLGTRHGLAGLGAAGADRHHHRRRLEDRAVHGAAHPRRVAGDPR